MTFPDRLHIDVHSGNHYELSEPLFPANHYFVNVHNSFYPWSSNMFTLDHVIIDAWATIDPSPTVIPAPVYVTYHHAVDATGSWLSIDLFAVLGATVDGSLPPRDQPYWLPDL